MASFGVFATISGLAVVGLTACAHPTAGTAVPVTTITTSPSVTVSAPPPVTVYVGPPATVTVPPATTQTPCQWMQANGYSYELAYAAWVQEGYPVNWDADHDGYPCEQSYGDRN